MPIIICSCPSISTPLSPAKRTQFHDPVYAKSILNAFAMYVILCTCYRTFFHRLDPGVTYVILYSIYSARPLLSWCNVCKYVFLLDISAPPSPIIASVILCSWFGIRPLTFVQGMLVCVSAIIIWPLLHRYRCTMTNDPCSVSGILKTHMQHMLF